MSPGSPTLHNVFRAPMARCSLFVLKVPLNTNQPGVTGSGMASSLQKDLVPVVTRGFPGKTCDSCGATGDECGKISRLSKSQGRTVDYLYSVHVHLVC